MTTDLLATPTGGEIEVLLAGRGEPVTVFAHGLGGSIADTRPLAGGVPGTRAFLHFRGHGRSRAADNRWDYPALAGELRLVADRYAATRALGVSAGAGALCRLLTETPDRFERVVFFLPAVLDTVRQDAAAGHLAAMAEAVEAGDLERLTTLLLEELPADARTSPEAVAWVRFRAGVLAGTALATALRTLPGETAIGDRSELRRVAVPALVIGQDGDKVHPVSVAEELAAALPHARLHVFGAAGPLWNARDELRRLVAGFLGER